MEYRNNDSSSNRFFFDTLLPSPSKWIGFCTIIRSNFVEEITLTTSESDHSIIKIVTHWTICSHLRRRFFLRIFACAKVWRANNKLDVSLIISVEWSLLREQNISNFSVAKDNRHSAHSPVTDPKITIGLFTTITSFRNGRLEEFQRIPAPVSLRIER